MSGHTKGPWFVYEAHGRYDNVANADGHIATCEFEEDAPAVAAVPNLLETLRIIAEEPIGGPLWSPGQILAEIERMARDAITKAEERPRDEE